MHDHVTRTKTSVMQVALTLSAGGTERLVIEITKRLSARFNILVCCLDQPGTWACELTEHGVEVIGLERQPGFHPALGRRIAHVAKERGVTVFHCHHFSPFVYGQIGALFSSHVRVIYTEHGRLSDGPPSLKRRIVNPLLGRLPEAICAVSENLKHYMVDSGFSEDRVAVVYNGIDPGPRPTVAERARARERLRLAPDAFVVGTVARLDPVKDLVGLVDAFRSVCSGLANAELIVIGDGPEGAVLQARVRDAGLSGRVRFVGHRDDARELLPALDLYANSSITEGVSLTILEAMAAGLPVVATAVGGTPEVVLEGKTGLLVPARAPEAMADAIIGLARERARGRTLGEAGRLRVEREFAIDRMVETYARMYAGMKDQ